MSFSLEDRMRRPTDEADEVCSLATPGLKEKLEALGVTCVQFLFWFGEDKVCYEGPVGIMVQDL